MADKTKWTLTPWSANPTEIWIEGFGDGYEVVAPQPTDETLPNVPLMVAVFREKQDATVAAAAPELCEALANFTAAIPMILHCFDSGSQIQFRAWCRQARAALAKAQGESPDAK